MSSTATVTQTKREGGQSTLNLTPPPPETTPSGLTVVPLHPTFAAELKGVDWSKPISPPLYKEIRAICDKARPMYGVVVCRNTGLDDVRHVEFSRHFGDLDDVTPYCEAGRKHRLSLPELFDAGNLDPDTGDVASLTAAQVVGNKANEMFHVDSSFNGRRAGHSLLLAHILPPKGTGGATEFSDSRTAYDELPAEMKKRLDGLVANHSLFHSRKKAMPDYFKDLDPSKMALSKHKLVQLHEGSGRMNLYIASYVHHIDDMSEDESTKLINELLAWVSLPRYRHTMEWEQPGDMIIWDNTSVMHRATGGTYEGKFRRDMRRTTVKDMSSTRFGLNGEGATWRVGLP